jgi:hypothetical protein
MTLEMEQMYYAALAADSAWSAALERRFGGRAGNARYDKRGVSTPKLQQLHHNFRVANDAWLEAARRSRAAASEVSTALPENR